MMNLKGLNKLKESYWFQFALLLAAVFLFWAKPVPFSNENLYLLRLIKPYQADFLLNDFIFSAPAKEHWLFDHLFGALTYFVSIEFIGWAGRIGCWTVLLAALLRLGRLWKIPLWTISVSIFLWLCLGQSVVADEWMIGVFEAKSAAYICLLFALDGFAREKEIYPAVLLGLSFSFHPAIGLWGIPAALLGLVFVRRDLIVVLRAVIISLPFSMFGVIPLLPTQVTNNVNSTENWRFFELVVFPFHMDPFSWARSGIVLMVLIGVFCLMLFLRNREDRQLKFLTFFLLALLLFFIFGIVLRALDLFDLLKYMPMRLYAVFAPLFLLLSLAKAYRHGVFAPPATALMILGVVCLLAWSSPIATGFERAKSTVGEWRSQKDDFALAFIWLRENIPNGTIVLAPPWRGDFWYLSQRAQVVSIAHAPISDLNGWQSRILEFAGQGRSASYDDRQKEMIAFYNSLTPEQAGAAAEKYGAGFFVSETDYAFPVAFQSGKVRVYKLMPAE